MISIIAPVVYADLGSFSLWIRARSLILITSAAQKVKFSIKDFLGKCDQICKETVDLVTFTKKILNGKPHFIVQCG